MNIADRISQMEADLNHYKNKSEADDDMISILKRQNETQAMEISKMSADHAEQVRALRQRTDLAVRNEREVRGILETAATGILQGLRKMKGDETPAPRAHAPNAAIHPALAPPVVPTEPIRHPTTAVPPEVSQFAPRSRQIESAESADGIDEDLRELVGRMPTYERRSR